VVIWEESLKSIPGWFGSRGGMKRIAFEKGESMFHLAVEDLVGIV
jgi:hypothetical protein